VTLAVDLTETPLSVRQTQLGTRVVLRGWPADPDNGSGLPEKTLWVALPEGGRARGVETRVVSTRPMTKRPVVLAPVPVARPDSPFAFAVSARYPKHHEAKKRPAPLARLLRTRTLGLARVALVLVSPVRVGPDGSLALATRFEITILLEADATATMRMSPVTLSSAQRRRAMDLAATSVVNPGDLRRLPFVPLDVTGGGAGGGEEAAYLIITDDFTWDATAMSPIAPIPQGLTGAFSTLRDWKASLGFTARMVTITDIVAGTATSGLGADFKTGAADLQEVIRRFISWAQANWGTAFVLLGGDQTVVPIRQLKMGLWTELMPTDMYYSVLDPAFDFDEGGKPDFGRIDSTVFEPDVSLGRAAVTSRAEADTFVAKVITYERAPLDPAGPGWLAQTLLAAAKLGGDIPAEFPPGAALPPGPDYYYHAPGAAYSLLQLIETITVTQDPDKTTTSPGNNCFNQAQGKAYVKVHLDGSTYRLPQDLYAVTPSGNVKLLHDVAAQTTDCGWFYTDWLNYDGPCQDAKGVNYPTSWIIAYVPGGASPTEINISLAASLRTGYNLLAKTGPGFYSPIPFDPAAGATRRGWYFAKSSTDVTPMLSDPAGGQTPSSWIAIFTSSGELAPQEFVLDPTDEADTESELEVIRKAAAVELPQWNEVSRLYPDVVDLPAADKSGDVEYYTQDRLRAKLNLGQHFVYGASHGMYDCMLWGGEGGDFDEPLADALVNAPRWGIGYGSACLTGRYTEDSLGRHLVVKNGAGGLVGFVGFMDELQMGLGVPFGQKLLDSIAATGRLGPAVDARATLLEPGSGVGHDDSGYRAIVAMSLLGDPAMVVHGTIVEPAASVGMPEFFASEAIALARLGGYANADRNQLDAQAQWQWTVGKTPDAITADLKDRYSQQLQRQLGLGAGAAADFYADTMARLATYGLAASVAQDPQPRDPGRDVHRAWALALLLLPAGMGTSIVLAQLLSRLDDASGALYMRPRRFLEMLFVSETAAIERISGTAGLAAVDGLAARACATRLSALRDELLTKAKTTIEGASTADRAGYYAAACLRLNAFGVDFGTVSANWLGYDVHYNWVLTAAVPNVVQQLAGRIRRIFEQVGYGDPPAAEVRIVQMQGSQAVEVVGSQLDFGAPVAGQSVTRKVRIYDVGDGDFLVTSPVLFGGFTPSNTTVTLREQRVDAMGACEAEVTFTASGSAPVTGSLQLETTAVATPMLTIDLRAAPLAPNVRFEPMGLDFASQKIGTSRTQSLVLHNTGTADASDLVLDMSRMQGPTAPQFQLHGAPAPHGTLAAGASVTFDVEFAPTEAVIIQTALRVTYGSAVDPGAAANSCAIIVGGWGIAPAIQAPASLDFGLIQPSQATVQSLTVHNGGQAGLVLSAVSVQGGLSSAFSIVQPDGSTAPALGGPFASIFPGTGTVVQVSVSSPNPAVHLSDSLVIASDDPAHQQLVISLMAATVGAAGLVQPDSVSFGVDPQPPNDVQIVAIESKGTTQLELYAVLIAGVPVATDGSRPAKPQDKLDFVAEGLPSKLTPLAAGSSLVFDIRFRPLASGPKQASLIVETNIGKLTPVSLSGTKS
jgi:hypothetical protein